MYNLHKIGVRALFEQHINICQYSNPNISRYSYKFFLESKRTIEKCWTYMFITVAHCVANFASNSVFVDQQEISPSREKGLVFWAPDFLLWFLPSIYEGRNGCQLCLMNFLLFKRKKNIPIYEIADIQIHKEVIHYGCAYLVIYLQKF